MPVKRETGENPVRTRHCQQGAAAKMSLVVPPGRLREQGAASQETCLSLYGNRRKPFCPEEGQRRKSGFKSRETDCMHEGTG